MTPQPEPPEYDFGGAAWQREVVEDNKSKILIAAIGRRGGKTTAQAQKLTAVALQSPGQEGWFVGRTLTKASELKDAMERDPGYRSLLLPGPAGIVPEPVYFSLLTAPPSEQVTEAVTPEPV